MSTREQTMMICDGCRSEQPTDRQRVPDTWVGVFRHDSPEYMHFCAECWRTAILAIYEKRPELVAATKKVNPQL